MEVWQYLTILEFRSCVSSSLHPSTLNLLMCTCLPLPSLRLSQGCGAEAASVRGVHKLGRQQRLLPTAPGCLEGRRGHCPYPHPSWTLALPGQPTGKHHNAIIILLLPNSHHLQHHINWSIQLEEHTVSPEIILADKYCRHARMQGGWLRKLSVKCMILIHAKCCWIIKDFPCFITVPGQERPYPLN